MRPLSYEDILRECENETVSNALIESLNQLFETYRSQLLIDVAERSIASRLASLLRPRFPELDVDVEYNRMGEIPKSIAWNEDPELVLPDIVVHQPMNNDQNLLVIEIKKSSSATSKENDLRKLAAFRSDLFYQHALFLRLGVGDHAGTVTECEWVK